MNEAGIYYQRTRSEMIPLLPRQYTKVLEIGCSQGRFRENLQLKHEYWGIEPVAAAATVAVGKLDKVLVGTYDQVASQLPVHYFDLVICNDVIEHLRDHDEFLDAIRRQMSPDGCLVASVPNVRYVENLRELLLGKDWEYRDEGILDRTHLRFFTKKSLLRCVSRHQYSIEECLGINPYRPDSLIKRAIYVCELVLFGQDIKFLQYGIRITPCRP